MAKNLVTHTRATVDFIIGEAPLPVVPTTVAADRATTLELAQPDLFDTDATRIPMVTVTIRMSDEFAVAAEIPAQAVLALVNQIDTAVTMGGLR